MRTILILTTIMTQLFLTNVSLAETDIYEDCQASCASDKGTRDVDCPSPYESSTGSQERDQCLKNSQEIYNSCIKSCPPSSTQSPPQSNSSPMSY